MSAHVELSSDTKGRYLDAVVALSEEKGNSQQFLAPAHVLERGRVARRLGVRASRQVA